MSTTDTTIPEFDAEITRVAEACSVPTHWVRIIYNHGAPEDEEEGAMRWTVRVTVLRPRATKYPTAERDGYGERLGEAADEAIRAVQYGYADGTAKPPS